MKIEIVQNENEHPNTEAVTHLVEGQTAKIRGSTVEAVRTGATVIGFMKDPVKVEPGFAPRFGHADGSFTVTAMNEPNEPTS